MADPAAIAELRDYIAEPVDAEPYTDLVLATLIDANGGDLNLTAKGIWIRKASSLSGLIDVKEGSSDRRLSQLHKNALEQVSLFTNLSGGAPEPTARRSRTRPIERL